MTSKQVETNATTTTPPPVPDANAILADLKQAKFAAPSDEDMQTLATLRSTSDPWKSRGETTTESLEALTKLRPFIHVGKVNGAMLGYVTIERDGPVPGAAYLRNIVVSTGLRHKGVGGVLLDKGLSVARDMNRKTLALRVDPANSTAVSFYRKNGFTTVATVVSKKSGKLRLLMSREL
ncbi:MAG: GNAT family N-acetyltransferase [Myxococcaceae bacterium]|nr:GNAT family N-acetyltransferase [Myxococcaceae bacterium]